MRENDLCSPLYSNHPKQVEKKREQLAPVFESRVCRDSDYGSPSRSTPPHRGRSRHDEQQPKVGDDRKTCSDGEDRHLLRWTCLRKPTRGYRQKWEHCSKEKGHFTILVPALFVWWPRWPALVKLVLCSCVQNLHVGCFCGKKSFVISFRNFQGKLSKLTHLRLFMEENHSSKTTECKGRLHLTSE